MTNEKLKELISALGVLSDKCISFCGIEIEICGVLRASHSDKWQIAPHSHPWFEFNYVQKGSVFTTVDGSEFLASKGMSYLIPPNCEHSHRHSNTGDDGLCLRFGLRRAVGCPSPDEADKIITALSKPRAAEFDSEIDTLLATPHCTEVQASALCLWLMKLFSARLENIDSEKHAPTSNHGSISRQVMLYLKESFSRPISISEIAAALGTSRRTLSRKFKAETGTTITAKLAEIRLSEAKRLLADSTMSVSEIARSSGFESEYYFSAAFKRRLGVSPLAYRKTHKSACFTH